MQLNLFWSAENENFGKILAIFLTYETYLSSTVHLERIPSFNWPSYRTFLVRYTYRAYRPMKSA